MRDELEKVINRIAATAEPEPDDFTDPVTGLLYCGKCHTPKQCRVTIFEKERLVPCLCQCETERREAEDAARREQEYKCILKKGQNGSYKKGHMLS